MNLDINTTWLSPNLLLIKDDSPKLPIDVDYIDISDAVITDPARLLPMESTITNSSNP